MDERTLVRRVAAAACIVAMLTMPVIRLALGDHESWIAGAHFLVLGIALLGLGRRRLSLAMVFGVTASLLLAVTMVSFWVSTGSVLAGGAVVGYGSGPLWLAAAMGPLLFLAFPAGRATAYVGTAYATFCCIFLVRAGAAAGAIVTATGLWFPALASALVLCATLAVALLAERSATERLDAEALRRRANEEHRRLASAQRRRRAVFSSTATELREPMAQLRRAVDRLDGVGSTDTAATARLVAIESGAVLDQIVGSLRTLVANVHANASTVVDANATPVVDANATPVVDEAIDDASEDDGRGARVGAAMVVLVVVAVLADALRLASVVRATEIDALALASAGSRMVLVLFLGAAVVAVRRPDPLGWCAVVVTLVLHPISVIAVASGSATPLLVQVMVPAWRNGVLATTFIVLLSAIVDRRARARDLARQEAASEVASSRALRQQEASEERMYAEAAHELKNPLSVITAGAETLASRDSLTPDQAEQLRIAVVRSTARLDDRLREMRAVAGAVDDGDVTVAPRLMAAQPALEAIVAANATGPDGRVVELDLQCSGALVALVPGHLDHVVENLLGNARAYGDEGGRIRLVARAHGGELHVELSNRGGTLTPVQAHQMFEPYWRASAHDHPAGSGLGLSIVSRLVAGWGGTHWCSVSDGWTHVGFTVPLQDAPTTTAMTARVPTLQA